MGNFLFNLLNDGGFKKTAEQTAAEVDKVVGIVVSVFYAVVAAVLIFFAIYLAYRMAKAEDDGQRKQAKAQLFYSIVGIVGCGILIVFLLAVIPAVANATAPTVAEGEYSGVGINTILGTVNSIIGTILKIICALIGVFACYVAWQFIKAEDDGKRKQAKQQLIYCFIGIVGAVLLAFVATTVLGLVNKPAE